MSFVGDILDKVTGALENVIERAGPFALLPVVSAVTGWSPLSALGSLASGTGGSTAGSMLVPEAVLAPGAEALTYLGPEVAGTVAATVTDPIHLYSPFGFPGEGTTIAADPTYLYSPFGPPPADPTSTLGAIASTPTTMPGLKIPGFNAPIRTTPSLGLGTPSLGTYTVGSPLLGAPPAAAGGISDYIRQLLEWHRRIMNSPIMKGANILSGIYGLMRAGEVARLARQASEAADPFGPHRAGYAAQLQALHANPAALFDTPMWRDIERQISRQFAARGLGDSGNLALALRNAAADLFYKHANQLAQLAGAQFSPAARSEALLTGTGLAEDLRRRALEQLMHGAAMAHA